MVHGKGKRAEKGGRECSRLNDVQTSCRKGKEGKCELSPPSLPAHTLLEPIPWKKAYSHEHVLVEVIEVVLQLLLGHGAVGIEPRVLVHVGEEDG